MQNSESSEEKRLHWQSHIDSWKSSGLSRAAYCRQAGISYYTFRDWLVRLPSNLSETGSSLTLVKLESQAINSMFSSKESISPRSSIRFWVNDFCVEVDNHFSQETLSQLIEVLRSQRCG